MLVINHSVHAPDILASRSEPSIRGSPRDGGNNSSWGDLGNDSALFYGSNKCQLITFVRTQRLRSSFFCPRTFCRLIRRLNRDRAPYSTSFRTLMRSICRTACVQRRKRSRRRRSNLRLSHPRCKIYSFFPRES